MRFSDLNNAAYHGDADAVRGFLKSGKIEANALYKALFRELKRGHFKIAAILLDDPRLNPSLHDSLAFRYSAGYGGTEIVKRLLKDPRVDPSAKNNEAIRIAADNGHIEVLKLLLNDARVNPSTLDNAAIRYAAGEGKIDIVKRLL
jgi:hypothetical protein